MSDTNNNTKQSSMTSFLKSKEFIIGVVVLLVIVIAVFYFVRKNREFSTKIDILAKKFEEQQQVLSKHDEVIGHLVGMSQRQHSILEHLTGQEEEPRPKPGNEGFMKPTQSAGFKIPEKPIIPKPRPAPMKPNPPTQNTPSTSSTARVGFEQQAPKRPTTKIRPPELHEGDSFTTSQISSRGQVKIDPIAETLTKNFAAGFQTMMSSVAEAPPNKSVRFANPPAQHFEPPQDEDDIEEESEPELEEEDDLDAELEEELRELQEMRDSEEEHLNNSASNKKK